MRPTGERHTSTIATIGSLALHTTSTVPPLAVTVMVLPLAAALTSALVPRSGAGFLSDRLARSLVDAAWHGGVPGAAPPGPTNGGHTLLGPTTHDLSVPAPPPKPS